MFEITKLGEASVVNVLADTNRVACRAFEDVLALAGVGNADVLIVSFAGCSSIDDACLSVLSRLRIARTISIRLVATPKSGVARTFELAGMHADFAIYDSIAAAVGNDRT